MARKLRIQYPGAIYHVMNRGDHQETIFCDEDDRKLFLATLAEGCAKTAFQIQSFCLMSNHFHLVVETPNANLVEGMKWLLGVYTSRFNRRHKVFGHLFEQVSVLLTHPVGVVKGCPCRAGCALNILGPCITS